MEVLSVLDLMGTVCAVLRSVQQVLKESALVEVFNLKAAIEYNMKNYEAAREAMADAPPRTEEELDPVRTAPLHSCHSELCRLGYHCILSFKLSRLGPSAATTMQWCSFHWSSWP